MPIPGTKRVRYVGNAAAVDLSLTPDETAARVGLSDRRSPQAALPGRQHAAARDRTDALIWNRYLMCARLFSFSRQTAGSSSVSSTMV